MTEGSRRFSSRVLGGGIDEETRDLGVRALNRRFDASHRNRDLGARYAPRKFDYEVQENVVRAELHRQRLAHPRDRGIALRDAANVGHESVRSGFSHEETTALSRENDGDHAQDHADDERRGGVEARLVEQGVEQHADERDDEARERGQILGHDGEYRRVLALSYRRPCRGTRVFLFELSPRDRERTELEHERDAEYDEVHRRIAQRLRAREVCNALVDRHAASEREQHDRDDEAPEVELFAVSVRMRLARWPAAAPQAEEQQELVSRRSEGG